MRMRTLWLTVAMTLMSACGVNIDVSGLKFQPAESQDSQPGPVDTVSPDLVQEDLSAPDEVDTSSPDVTTYANCWEVFDCLIFQEKGWDLAFNKFMACGAESVDGELVGAIAELENCLDVCMLDQSLESFAECLGAYCIAESIVCMNDGSTGDKTCADALWCSVQQCSSTTERPAQNGLECLIDCYGGMSAEEVDELVGVVDECVKKEGGANPDCVPTAQHCFADSGEADKSCWDVAQCLQDCSSCPDGDPGCHPETCLIDCLWGMSQEAYEQYSGMTDCFSDPFANAFGCLEEALLCVAQNLAPGAEPCMLVMENVMQIYYAEGLTPGDQYDEMFGSLWQLSAEELEVTVDVIHCLEEKWEVFPGYGNMPPQQFQECSDMCI